MSGPDPAEAFATAVRNAGRCADQADWDGAAELYARAAAFAMDHEALDAARQAWGRAGEAFRRADRPVDASRALRLALGLPGGGDAEIAVQRVQLSAVLSETGEMSAAAELCREAAHLPGARPMALDGLFSVLLGIGTRDALDALLPELAPTPWSHALRGGQLARMHGDLARADALLAGLEVELAGHPAGLGGIRAERAEIAALRGDPRGAADAWEDAAREQREAGRLALAWRAEAGRVRCLLEAGVEPLAATIAEGLTWARARGMTVLALDLGLVDGMARGDAARLAAMRDEARSLGLLRRAGRAGLARAARLSGPARLLELQDARSALADDLPWSLRADVLRAETLAARDPAAGRAVAQGLIAPLTRAGMAPELTRANHLMGA